MSLSPPLRKILGVNGKTLRISADSLSNLAKFSVKKPFGCALLSDPTVLAELFGENHYLTKAAKEGGVRLHLAAGAFKKVRELQVARQRRSGPVEAALWEQFQFLVQNNAAELVTEHTPTFGCTPVVMSSPFLHPKVPAEEYDVSVRSHSRFIVNMKPSLNQIVANERFRQDGVEQVREMIAANDFLSKFDQVQAYHQTPIFPAHRQLCRFHIFEPGRGWRVGQLRCLTMGLAPSARVQTKIGKAVIELLQRNGGKGCLKIDDWIVAGSSREDTLRSTWLALAVLVLMGSPVHFDPAKSSFNPAQSMEYIGVVWQTRTSAQAPWGLCLLPEGKVLKFLAACREMARSLEAGEAQSHRDWLKLAGIVTSALDCVPALWLYTRRLAMVGRFLAGQGLDQKAVVPEQLKAEAFVDLNFWLNTPPQRWNGAPLIKLAPMAFCQADSSLWATGLWAPADYACANRNPEEVEFSEFWNGETQGGACAHINQKELRGSCRRLIELIRHRDYRRIVLGVGLDSTVALSYYPRLHGRKWGGKQAQMSDDTHDLFHECTERQIILSSVHVPGIDMKADASSRRLVSLSDFALSRSVFEAIMKHFGPLANGVDLFADAATKKLARYVSAKVDSRAEWTNAFSRSWEGLVCFAHPPLRLVQQVVNKFISDKGGRMILVAPLFWSNAQRAILNACVEPPLLLPRHSEAFAPPLGWDQTEPHQLLPSARWPRDGWNWIAYDLSLERCAGAASEHRPPSWYSTGGKMQELIWTEAGAFSPSFTRRARRIQRLFQACQTW